MEYSDKLFENCANWWFDTFIGSQIKDNGDRGPNGFLAGGLAGMLADNFPVYERDRPAFVKAFVKEVKPRLVNNRNVWFDCDYGPNRALCAAMENAGIHPSRAPWKTRMRIGEGHSGYGCELAAGYGAPYKLVWDQNGEVPKERVVVEYLCVVDESTGSSGKVYPREEIVYLEKFYHQNKVEQFLADIADSKKRYEDPEQQYATYYNEILRQWTEVLKDGEWTVKS